MGLRSYGYVPEEIKLSDLLKQYAQQHGISVPAFPESRRIDALMGVGDLFCAEAGDPAAVVLDALVEIGARREVVPDSAPRAWILDSLKRTQEVSQLRQVYGDHLVVISAQAGRDTRKTTLKELIAPKSPSLTDEEAEREVDLLLDRDLNSGNGPHCQNVVGTFPLADWFVSCDDRPLGSTSLESEVSRFLDLLFGSPQARIPTEVEFGMYLASVAATRSPELGRKVGAAILDGISVSALGVNSHPVKSGDAPHLDRSKVDLSRLVLDVLRRLNGAGHLSGDLGRLLEGGPDEAVQNLLEGALKGSDLTALTEFQVPVHAEMAALLDALGKGRPVAGQKIYVTAYPCHGCAKHLLRADLSVVYLDPYPKSRAAAMYGSDGADRFEAFTGVAPARYMSWFPEGERRAASDGSRIVWDHGRKLLAEPRVVFLEESVIRQREAVACLRSPSAQAGTQRTLEDAGQEDSSTGLQSMSNQEGEHG